VYFGEEYVQGKGDLSDKYITTPAIQGDTRRYRKVQGDYEDE